MGVRQNRIDVSCLDYGEHKPYKDGAIRTETLEPVSVVISFKSYKPGDINGDFKIDETDLELALQNYRKPDNTRGDINKNGITDIYDLAYIKKNFGNLD
mgnify:CR=1 FL=1